MTRRLNRLRTFAAILCCAALVVSGRAEAPIKVKGLGWMDNREMRLSLGRLITSENGRLDANAIEDAAVILSSALAEEGFQQPVIDIVATLAEGGSERFRFDPTFANPIPRPLDARSVLFDVKPGVRWRVGKVQIDGLTQFPAEEGVAYFRSDAALLNIANANAYSKSRVNRSENALLDELRRRGHAEAEVSTEPGTLDPESGEVDLRVHVREGPEWLVSDVELDGNGAEGVTPPDMAPWQGTRWTPTLEQDIKEAVRLAYYRAGYPDVGLHMETEASPPEGGKRQVAVLLTVVPGTRVRMGTARFEGNEKTRESVLRRRVTLETGEPLNPIELERSRFRISRLGVFRSVDLRYEPVDGDIRDPVFVLKEGQRHETNLLFGYGSYEQFRAGVEYRQMNIFGMAHQSRLLAIYSLKSIRAEYTYNVPELFGESVDGSAKLFGLEREEIAFERQEYGVTLALRRPIPSLHGEATAGYTFQALRNRKSALSTVATDEKQLNVASVTFGLTTDRRDNPLRPRRGYHANTQIELASPIFGGVAQYQRFEFAGAYHTPWGRGRWVHVGFSHGVITTVGAENDRELPVNKRFFPGGDNSIRGYQTGEAAPRLPDGRFIGAKAYWLMNFELEQALTQSWSIVAFGDALGVAASLRDYPGRERLYSVGLGLRYQTIVGPIRLEYGRNVDPRPADPSGTWQISLGYPF